MTMPRPRDPVVQELAIRIDDRPEIAEGGKPGGMRAEARRLQRRVGGERGDRADPGAEISNDGGPAIDVATVGTDEHEAPRLHRQGAAPGGPDHVK